MKRAIVAALLLACGCGKGEEPAAKMPETKKPDGPGMMMKAETPRAPEVKSDPNGKFTCLACNLKTSEANCPKCKAQVGQPAAAPPSTPKTPGEVGKSAVAALFACPKPGCDVKFPSKGTCLKHSDTQMVEEHFACAKCAVKSPQAGKCEKCGEALKSTVK
jgi:hypothetical protein